LRQVIVVHRHGTRFPTKPVGAANLSWPQRANFWEKYKGHLTPVGCKQLEDVGAALRERYSTSILSDSDQLDGRVVAVYTSNIQRTLQSAWSFLLGLIPDASIFFAFRSERIFSDALRQAVGVPIYVEDATEGDDKLFHEWTIEPGYKKWLKENQQRSEFLQYAKDAPEYVALLDKLYANTGERKLTPGREPLARLVGAKDVDTLVTIDEAHRRPILPNEYGEPLLPEEQKMLRKIGDEVKRCWFADAGGDYACSYGRRGAEYLAHKIWRHMDESARVLCHLRFVEFSCHDTTMAALAAHFGIELPKIGFGAFFALELHTDREHGHHVKCFYNGQPDMGESSYASLRSIVLPLGSEPKIQRIDECPTGYMTLESFREHCQIPGLEETFESFMKLLGRADLGPTREDLESLLEHGNSWLSFSEWKEHHHAKFVAFDVDGDGALCKDEMQEAVKHWYGISGKTSDLVFHLLDRDPEEDALSERDVYLAMCALVGVRGSISSNPRGAALPLPSARDGDERVEDVNARSKGGTTKLMSAANTGDLQRIRELVARGADVNLADDFGWTALRYAVRKKDLDVVRLLIDSEADVNQASKTGRTPLMSAVANYAPDVVQLLVEHGANTSARNRDGMTALDIASRGGGMGSSVVRTLVAL